jgi:hypothetical protein
VTSTPEVYMSICVVPQREMLLTVGMVSLGVPRSQRVKLAECLEIVQRELIAQKMKDDVLKSTATWGDELVFRAIGQVHLRMTVRDISESDIRSERPTRTYPLESTKRSRLNHFELFGLALKNLIPNRSMKRKP